MTTGDYLDAIKAHLGIDTDYALAKHLGISTSRVGNWRSGRSLPDVDMLTRFAEILGSSELLIYVDIQYERASDPKVRAFYQRMARKLQRWAKELKDVAVIALMAIGLVASPQDARASFDTTPYCGSLGANGSGGEIPVRNATGNMHCVSLRRRLVGFVRWCALAWLALSFCSL